MEQIRVTEQASAYDDLQRMSVHDLLTGINREDRRVADAVAATIPTMERLVERIVERMQRGGRMFYIGAGTRFLTVEKLILCCCFVADIGKIHCLVECS